MSLLTSAATDCYVFNGSVGNVHPATPFVVPIPPSERRELSTVNYPTPKSPFQLLHFPQ